LNSYHNICHETGEQTPIKGYDYRSNYITVYFKNDSIYHYSVASCGEDHIANMKSVALAQRGLNTYITENMPRHEWKREPLPSKVFSNAE
jgi:hypothetical protein